MHSRSKRVFPPSAVVFLYNTIRFTVCGVYYTVLYGRMKFSLRIVFYPGILLVRTDDVLIGNIRILRLQLPINPQASTPIIYIISLLIIT